jgi:ABC-2 type transport system ATP-binding protein
MLDSPPVLEVRNLVKRYGACLAVRDVSFAIHAGEILGVLGPNGAGKSTIVKMIAGLVEPTQGAVLFRGEPVANDHAAYNSALGYVPEQPDLYGFLSGWEYLELAATLRGIEEARFNRKASVMLRALSLYEHRDLAIAGYSKGMRQRIVAIAALLDDPALLVLDEPFSGLDTASTLILRRVVARLAAAGKAVFFSSPVLEHVDQLCSRLVLLKGGTVVASGPMDEMRTRFAGLGLEGGFLQLTEPVDADGIAGEIVDAMVA